MDGKVLIHRAEVNGLYNPEISLSEMIGNSRIVIEPDARLDDGDVIHIGKIPFQILHTPGHTMGSFCFLFDHLLFSGDTLFYRGIGRTDLKGGEYVLLSVF